MDRNRLMPRAGPFRLNPQDSRHPGGLDSLLEPEFIRRFRRLPQKGKKRLAGICVHLQITPRGSVIAGNPRMGILSPKGLQMCKLRLWLAREVATRRTERLGCPSAPWGQGRGSAVSPKSAVKRRWKPQRGNTCGRAMSCQASRRSPLAGEVLGQCLRLGSGFARSAHRDRAVPSHRPAGPAPGHPSALWRQCPPQERSFKPEQDHRQHSRYNLENNPSPDASVLGRNPRHFPP